MNEPLIFKYENGQLTPQGQLPVEMQTPEQYIAHSPLVEREKYRWGRYVVRLAYLEEVSDTGEVRIAHYAFAQQIRDDGHGMEAKWALIVIDNEEDVDKFRMDFKSYCEKTS